MSMRLLNCPSTSDAERNMIGAMKSGLWALREASTSLVSGLPAVIDLLEHETVLIPEIRHSRIQYLKGLSTLSEEIYGQQEPIY